MAWRAAASFLSFAMLLVSATRATAAFARSPYHVVGAGVIAGILAITAFGAFNVLLGALSLVASLA